MLNYLFLVAGAIIEAAYKAQRTAGAIEMSKRPQL